MASSRRRTSRSKNASSRSWQRENEMNEDRRKLRKLVDVGEGDGGADVLGFDRLGWSYAIITQIDTEKEKRRIIRYHIKLHCLSSFWFDLNYNNLPPWDQIAHVAAMFHTE